jgi:hypothetical protein
MSLIKKTEAVPAVQGCASCGTKLYRSDAVLCSKCARDKSCRERFRCDLYGRKLPSKDMKEGSDVPENS